MPQLELGNTVEALQPSSGNDKNDFWPFITANKNRLHDAVTDTALLDILQTPVGAFMCPSTAGPELNEDKPMPYDSGNGTIYIARADYLVVNDADNMDREGPDGCFVWTRYDAPFNFASITDGLSNTAIIGERCYLLSGDTLGSGVVFGHGGNQDGNNALAAEVGFVYVAGSGITPINSTVSDSDNDHRQGFASNHPGGANFLFADGSVHFLAETIDHDTNDAANSTYEYLLQRNDGEVLGDY